MTSALSGQPIYDLDPFPVENSPIIEQIELTSGGEAVTRIGAEQIQQLGAGDLSSALRRVPGVTVSRYNIVGAFGGGDGGAVFIRGQGSGRPGSEIATMTDGIARFVGVWTHPLLDTLPTDFAGSIQVYKSPQPVRFGNMAFGAVNIVPARAVGDGWSGRTRLEVGAWDTLALFGEAGYTDDTINIHAGISHRESDGHRANADGQVNAYQARAAIKFADNWQASFLVQVMESWAHDPEATGSSLPIVERYGVENQFYLATLERSGEAFDFSLKAYSESGDLDWRQWHVAPPAPFPAQQLNTLTEYGNHGLRSSLVRAFWENLIFRGGLDYDRYGGEVVEVYSISDEQRFDEQNFELTAPYGNVEWTYPLGQEQELILSAGARYLGHDVFQDETALQAGAVLQNRNASFYANLAKSYNFPGVYVSVFGRRPPPWSVGEEWRDLEAEAVEHAEIGIQFELGEDLVLDVAVFNDQVDNALRIATPPPAGVILNLGSYDISGAELSARGRLGENLLLYSGLSFLDADAGVPNAPEWTFTLGADWAFLEDWGLSGDLQFVDDQEIVSTRFDEMTGTIDSHILANIRISRVLELSRGSLEAWLRADNLLDEEYEYRPGYPMPGVSLSAGVQLTF